MLVRSIDGVVSRMMHGVPHGGRTAGAALWMTDFLDAGLRVVSRVAGRHLSSSRSGEQRIRWMELQNKISAYRLFRGRDRTGHVMEIGVICGLDHHSRLFAAEGHSYRTFLACTPIEPWPRLSLISVHAGAALFLAEKALKGIERGKRLEGILAEFSAECERVSLTGSHAIMQDVFGLVVRTMYPHSVEKFHVILQGADAEFCQRFWHGVGRAIYFAPTNIPPSRALPWNGIAMCLREAPNDVAKRNVLSGFCFALTMVNLKTPAVLEGFLRHHREHTADYMDGVHNALRVGVLSREAANTQIQQSPFIPGSAATKF